jgi:hypothetical protein
LKKKKKKIEKPYLIFGQNLRKKFTKSCKVYQTVMSSISKVSNLFFQPKKIIKKKKNLGDFPK